MENYLIDMGAPMGIFPLRSGSLSETLMGRRPGGRLGSFVSNSSLILIVKNHPMGDRTPEYLLIDLGMV